MYVSVLNPESAIMQTTKFTSAKVKKEYPYREFKDESSNNVDPDEVAHYEPPHLDLHCLPIQLFSFLAI